MVIFFENLKKKENIFWEFLELISRYPYLDVRYSLLALYHFTSYGTHDLKIAFLWRGHSKIFRKIRSRTLRANLKIDNDSYNTSILKEKWSILSVMTGMISRRVVWRWLSKVRGLCIKLRSSHVMSLLVIFGLRFSWLRYGTVRSCSES